MTPHYHINVFWSDEDDCWIADVPDLRYCSAHGTSPQEAVSEAQIAIALFIESLVEHGDPIPKPHYRSAAAEARAA